MVAIVAGLVALRFLKLNGLGWAVATWIAVYLIVSYGVDPPIPSSIVSMYMGIMALVLLAYLSASGQRLKEAGDWLVAFLTEKRYHLPLILVLIAAPGFVAFNVYLNMSSQPVPPVSGRTIHPPPPGSITFKGKTIDLISAENPFRELESSDPDAFSAHIDAGRVVYYQNCVYCHGDNMEGDGMYAHGFSPIPANFQDPTTIAMLQESYLFWRIAKGAPGLPVEATPWSSAMPAWELFLSEEEIWDVILFLYDYTDQKPRAKEVHE